MADARDIIADIDAILRGDISGPEQVRAVLRAFASEIRRLATIADVSRANAVTLDEMQFYRGRYGALDQIAGLLETLIEAKDPTP